MTIFEFRKRSIRQQAAILYKHGVYIGKRSEDGKIMLLYQLNAYYVELFYNEYRKHIHWIGCFESTDLLDPYLENMNVADLVV
ncbi:MAG TPA: hypothetical protein VM012_00630 [Flavitalea sp.]|nr:hypothetical protein [Flavitalea sp.]